MLKQQDIATSDGAVVTFAAAVGEVFHWDPDLAAAGLRMCIQRSSQGLPVTVLLLDQPDGSTLMHSVSHTELLSDAQVRQCAYPWLAQHDPRVERRAFWAARARCADSIATESFYEQVAALNIVFGPGFRAVREIWRGRQEAIGRVELSPELAAQAGAYVHHPVFLDACLQLFGATLFGEMSRKTFLPVGMESFDFDTQSATFAWSHVRLRKEVALEDKSALADFLFFDRELRQVGEILGFSLRLSDRTTLLEHDAAAAGNCSYQLAWERLERAQGAQLSAQDIRVLGSSARASALRDQLQALGTGAEPAQTGTVRGVVMVVDQDQACAVPDPDATASSAWQLIESVRTLGLEAGDGPLQRLWFLTQSTQQVTGHDAIQADQAFVWGVARSLEREYPQLQVLCLDAGDVGDAGLAEDAAALAAELLSGSAETMVAFRGGARYVGRLRVLAATPAATEPADDAPRMLATRAYGSLDNLYWAPMQRSALGPQDVEIRVHATGLNFKDVLHAMGLLAQDGVQSGVEHASAMLFGGDCAGVVLRTGSEVHSLKVGDRVMACMAFGSFASHVTVRAPFVAKLPEAMPWHVGAAIPTAYLTAYHALVTRGGLQSGQRVLIHSAAGGVGLAALQLAKHLGAEVYATASRSKHDYLRTLGVQGVYDSRSLGFAEQLAKEQPALMDLVLNCLNGDFVEQSFAVLKQGGSFIEIGKIGVWSDAEAAERRSDASYALFDLMDLAQESPDLLTQEFSAVLALMDRASLAPARVQTFPMARIDEAFRCMAEARHIGKIVVTQRPDSGPVLRADRCHVVAGGAGSLGRETLNWLARAGARHVAVLGRSEPDEPSLRCFDLLRAQGIELRFVRADLSDRAQAENALKRIAEAGVGIGAIFHLAGQLSDALLRNQTSASVNTVFQSKLGVAVNLHLASLAIAHDHFVCFSSIAAVFGSPGQSNYAAANAVMDALMHHRRSVGLPGLSINWGPWAGGGMAQTLSAADQARLSETGLTPLQPTEAFDMLERLLVADYSQVCVVHADWSRPGAYPGGRVPPYLAALAGSSASHATQQGGAIESIAPLLRSLPAEARHAAMLEATTQCICQVLRLAPSDISPEAWSRRAGLGFTDGHGAAPQAGALDRRLAGDFESAQRSERGATRCRASSALPQWSRSNSSDIGRTALVDTPWRR